MKNLILVLFLLISFASCKKSNETSSNPITNALPTLTTKAVTAIDHSFAISGADISNQGETAITTRGLCWSRNTSPTLSDNFINSGTGTISFLESMEGLNSSTTYYVRAFATNSNGTAYGNQQIFNTKDISPITIGTQIWMQQDFNSTNYRNGDPIPQVMDEIQWRNLTTGAWCYYVISGVGVNKSYGKLYNWYAVNDPRGIMPSGWHVPTNAEWTTLTTFLGGEPIAGGKMKPTYTWNLPNTGATNSSGFTATPNGYRNLDGSWGWHDRIGIWWSASPSIPAGIWTRKLTNISAGVTVQSADLNYGYSIRGLKD